MQGGDFVRAFGLGPHWQGQWHTNDLKLPTGARCEIRAGAFDAGRLEAGAPGARSRRCEKTGAGASGIARRELIVEFLLVSGIHFGHAASGV